MFAPILMPKQVAPKIKSFDTAGAWGGKAQKLEEGCHPEEEEREEGWKQARAMKYFVRYLLLGMK